MKLSFGALAFAADSFAAIALAGGVAYPDDGVDHGTKPKPAATEQDYVYPRQPDQAAAMHPRQPDQADLIHPRTT